MFETDGCCNPREQFLASKHLKVVEVKYHGDEVLHKILKILSTYGVPPEKIEIQQINLWSSSQSKLAIDTLDSYISAVCIYLL